MALQDINWGAVIIGAAAITAIAAVAMTPAGFFGLELAGTALASGGGQAATFVGASLAGGVLGHWTTKVTERLQDSAVALVHR